MSLSAGSDPSGARGFGVRLLVGERYVIGREIIK